MGYTCSIDVFFKLRTFLGVTQMNIAQGFRRKVLLQHVSLIVMMNVIIFSGGQIKSKYG